MMSRKLKSISINIIALAVILICLTACGGKTTDQKSIDANIIFEIKPDKIQLGECAMIRWESLEGFGSTINGENVEMAGEMEVCPPETIEYTLSVDMGDRIENRQVSLQVIKDSETKPVEQSETETVSAEPSVPAYQADAWVRLGGPPGGLGYDIRMDPRNPDVMYVTASPGGIFKSTDGGLTWKAQNQGLETYPGSGADIFCATIDPHNPDIIWIGTQFTGHVYRSTDGGQTWEQRDNGIIETVGENSIRGITIDPNDPDTVFVAMEHGTGMSGVTGEVYKSRDDGENFVSIWKGNNLARYVWIDPRNSNRIYVSTGIFDRIAINADPENNVCGGVGIIRSDDGGQNWTVLEYQNGLGGLHIPSLYMHPTNPDILLAGVHRSEHCPDEIPGVYVTRDGGDTWQAAIDETLNNADMYAEPFNINDAFEAVEISESNPDIWYAAGREIFFRSEDAGQTWEGFMLGTKNHKSGVPIDIQVDPRDPYRVFINNYLGGNFLSTNGGETWIDASSGYTGVTVNGLVVSPNDPKIILAGVNENAFRSSNGGVNWDGLGNIMMGMDGAISTNHGLIIAAGNNVYLSSDEGITWTSIKVVDFQVLRLFLSMALIAAPTDPETVYIGYADLTCFTKEWVYCKDVVVGLFPGIHRSRDGGLTWQPIGSNLFWDTSIMDLAISPNDPLTVFAATTKGPYKSTDGGDSWQELDGLEAVAGKGATYAGDPIPTSHAVAVDPFDPQTIYVGSAHNGVWRSRDGGVSWEAISTGMDPNETINDLLPDPNHSGLIYAATEFSGIYYSTDNGDTWQYLDQGLDYRKFRHLALSADGSILYAGSHGAGVFRLGTLSGE